MTGSVRRIAVQPSDDVGGDAVDIALPAGVEVAVLVPAIVDLVAGVDGDAALAWSLWRIGGPALDASKTLAENEVRDGDLLLLNAGDGAAAPRTAPGAVTGSGTDGEQSRWSRRVRLSVALWTIGVGGAAVGWAGLLDDAPIRGLPAAVLALVTGGAAVLTRRRHDDAVVTALALAAVLLGAVFGLLAVPGGPAPPNVLLAAAAGTTTAVLLMRLTERGTVPLTAISTLAAIVAISVAPGAVGPVSTLTVGVVAASTAIGLLGLAPRLSLVLAGLTPELVTDSDVGHDADADEDRLVRGNALLTGVLSGAAAAATLGAVLVALGSAAGGPWRSGAVFVATVAAALVLRARSHADPARRSILIGCGLGCATAGFMMITLAVPAPAAIAAMIAVGAGVAVLTTRRAGPVSPLARRGVDLLEYLTLATLLPLACYLTGLYSLVRSLSL